MQITKNIALVELVGPDVYRERGYAAAQLMDLRIVKVAQWIRDYTGKPMTINSWQAGGRFEERGLRSPLTDTGAKWSQHKFGRAIDFNVDSFTSDQIRKIIRDNWAALKEIGLTTIEQDTQGWVHIDCRYTALDYLLEVPFK